MPRLIDHDARNDEIAAASFRVLEREGLTGLSVRKVAEEAGIAAASLRRAFPTQDALRQFCFERIRVAVATRLNAVTGDARERALQALKEFLPLDDPRRTELVVQLQLSRLAAGDDAMRVNAEDLHDGVGGVCAAVLDDLFEAGLLATDIDLDLEAVRLHALLDGLALHLLWNVSGDPEDHADRVLARHLDSLAT